VYAAKGADEDVVPVGRRRRRHMEVVEQARPAVSLPPMWVTAAV